MVDAIVGYLYRAYSVYLDVKEVTATVLATFTHLKTASSSGWADFSKSIHETNSSYEYRVLFDVRSNFPDTFWSIVTTIKLTADIETESAWWGLESSSTQKFSAEIETAQLFIRKGFKDPGL